MSPDRCHVVPLFKPSSQTSNNSMKTRVEKQMILYFTGSGQKCRNQFCGNKSFMVFSVCKSTAVKSSTVLHSSTKLKLIGQCSSNKFCPVVRARKHRRRNNWCPYWWQITTCPHRLSRCFPVHCLKPISVLLKQFLNVVVSSKREEGGKTNLIGPEVRYVACNQSVCALEASFVFPPIRQKSRFWTTERQHVKYQASFSLSLQKEKGRRNAWLQVKMPPKITGPNETRLCGRCKKGKSAKEVKREGSTCYKHQCFCIPPTIFW